MSGGTGVSSDPGLCASCRHAAVIRGARSRFWMCRRSATDPSFDRYPRLPILQCRGYEPGEPEKDGAARGGEPGGEPRP
jgi:hypothetical protein